MLSMFLSTSLLLVSQTDPTAKAAEGTLMVLVADDAKVIQEASLQHQGNLAARQDLARRGMVEDAAEETPNGRTLYRFRLKPGERLALALQAKETGRMFMRFLPAPVQDAMAGQYRLANTTPKQIRSKSIKIRNVLETPTEVVLGVYGPVNLPFELKIERQ